MTPKTPFLLCLTLLTSIFTKAQTDLFTPQKSIEFAAYLFNNNEFDLAAAEYQRLYFLLPTDTNIINNLLYSNYKLKQYQQIILFANKIGINKLSELNFAKTIYAKTLVLNANYLTLKQCQQQLTINKQLTDELNLVSAFFTHDFTAALNTRQQNQNNQLITKYSPVYTIIDNSKTKSPALAVAMSVIVPGTGKIYSGYWKDGLMSLFFVGISAWQSYSGFNKKGVKSLYGWIYAGMGAGFYFGNLYGSAKAANKHNKVIYDKVYNQTENIFYNSGF